MNLHNNNEFALNSNNLLKFLKNDIQEFKNSLNCFSLFEDRIIESVNFELSDSILIDVGFKYIMSNIRESRCRICMTFFKFFNRFYQSLFIAVK